MVDLESADEQYKVIESSTRNILYLVAKIDSIVIYMASNGLPNLAKEIHENMIEITNEIQKLSESNLNYLEYLKDIVLEAKSILEENTNKQ